MFKAGSSIRLTLAFGTVLAAGGLAGCEGPHSPVAASQAAPAPLAIMPGPGKTLAAYQQDDAACRAAIAAGSQQTAQQSAAARSNVVLAAEAGAGPVGTSSDPSTPEVSRPDASYASCMVSKHNVVR